MERLLVLHAQQDTTVMQGQVLALFVRKANIQAQAEVHPAPYVLKEHMGLQSEERSA